MAQRVQSLRVALIEAVSTADLAAVIKRLVREARGGDIAAVKVLLDRLLGPPQPLDIIERLEALEARMGNKP